MAGTKAGEMWIEMGINDKVTKNVEVMAKTFKTMDNNIKEVVNGLRLIEDALDSQLGDDEKSLFTKKTLSEAKEYYDLVAKITQAQKELNTVVSERSKRGMRIAEDLEYLGTLSKLRKQLMNDAPVGDEEFVKAYRLSLENTLRETKDYLKKARGEFDAFDKQEAKRLEIKKQITAETERLSAVEDRISRMREDTKGKADIANIKGQRVEYDALLQKVKELDDLLKRVAQDKASVARGNTSTITDSFAIKELDAIQRRYNESVARGKEIERQSAEAKRQAAEASKRLAAINNELSSSYNKVTQSGRQTMSTLSMLRQQAGYYFSLFGAQTLLKNVITIGGQFEFQHVALQNIIGDAEKANSLFAQLKDLAIDSPKTFMELASSMKQLSAYQIPANELYDTTKRLSDLSVGLGVDINRLILAFGQVRSAAVLRGQELRQFTEAGIPMVQALADKFTKMNGKLTTTADVFKLISQRAVSFEMVRDVMWEMTNQGGQFYNMQATMADTLYGKWQKLQDIWQITLGDIADANSLSGKFFKTALDGVIFLARNLQSLVPLVSIFSAFKVFKGIKNSLFEGTGKIDANIAKAQKLQQIELRRRLLNGEISKEYFKQATALNNNKSTYYQILATEGKISDRKIAQLAIEDKINKRIAYRILLEKGYNKEQIRNAMANKGAGLAGQFEGMGKRILGFIGGWTGAAVMGIGAIISAYTAYSQRMEEINEKAKTMADSAKEKAKELKDAYESISRGGTPTSQEELIHQVNAMKELLKNQDLYTASIDKSVESAKSLTEKYEILKIHVKEAAESQQLMVDYAELAKEAVKDSGGMRYKNGVSTIDDRVDTNIQELESEYTKYTTLVSSLGDTRKKLDEEISKIGGAIGATLKGKDLEEQIRILAESDYWDGIIERISETDSDLGNHLKKIGDKARETSDRWKDVAESDIPDIVRTIKKEIPVEGEENIRKWAKSNEKLVQAMINAIAKTVSFNAPKIREAFVNALRGAFGLESTELGNVKEDNSIYKKQSYASKQLIANVIKAYGQGVTSVKEMANWIGDTDNQKTYAEAFDGIKKSRDAAKEAYDAAKSASTDSSKEKAEYERLEKIYKASGADAFFKAQAKERNNNKGNRVDEYAKAMRERVSVVKGGYSEYKKWSALIGKEAAAAKIKSSGIFDSLFADKDFKGLDDFKGELERIRKTLNPSKTEQRKVIATIDNMLLGMEYDDAKEKSDKAIELMRSSMTKIASQWEAYRKIFEKTGNKSLADLAFTGGVQWDEKARAMAKELEKSVGKSGISFDMSDEEAKDYFDYSTDKGKALYEQWKTISDLIKNNYVTALMESADAQAAIMTNAQKIEMLQNKIAELQNDGSGIDHTAEIKQMTDEIDKLNSELFETLPIYEKIFGDRTYSSYKSVKGAEKAARELIGNAKAGPVNPKTGKASYYTSFYMDGDEIKKVTLTREQLERLKKTLDDYHKDETKKDPFSTLAEDLKNLWNVLKSDNSSAEEKEEALRKFGESALEVSKIIGDFAGQLSSMFDALGNGSMSEAMDDVNAAMNSVNNIGQGFATGGPIGGIVAVASEAVNWIGRLAQKHDRKLDKAIQKSTRRVKELQNAYKNLETEIDRALGGIYTAGGYDEMFQNYKNQLAELEKQRKAENDKKKKDQDKLLDYDQQIKEMENTIKYFAQDMAKELYNIDVKSWAQELTDAVVEAWAKGEDAVQAWHDKVRDLVKDITKNILAKKVVEMALDPVLDYVTDQMTAKNGKLDESDVVQIAKLLESAGESSVNTITSLLDAMKRAGFDMTESDSKSGNLSSSIKSITEDAGDLLVSYVNAIRADVSINREQLAQIVLLMQNMPTMNATAQLQLRQLETIAVNTGRNADSNDEILSVLRGWIVSGIYTPKIK